MRKQRFKEVGDLAKVREAGSNRDKMQRPVQLQDLALHHCNPYMARIWSALNSQNAAQSRF